jgi:hypothetical protein
VCPDVSSNTPSRMALSMYEAIASSVALALSTARRTVSKKLAGHPEVRMITRTKSAVGMCGNWRTIGTTIAGSKVRSGSVTSGCGRQGTIAESSGAIGSVPALTVSRTGSRSIRWNRSTGQISV